VQVFLQAKLLGIEAFVGAAAGDLDSLGGRCLYASLISETLPRALLDHLGLSRQLIGSTGGGQFLVMLTVESVPEAHNILAQATRHLASISAESHALAGPPLRIWRLTDIRKRLADQIIRCGGLAPSSEGVFELSSATHRRRRPFADHSVPSPPLLGQVRFEQPLLLARRDENFRSRVTPPPNATAWNDGRQAGTAALAAKAAGRPLWGILRSDVDQFSPRLRRAQTIDESLECSLFFRNFFAGEVQVLCAQAEFWQKVTVLYTGAMTSPSRLLGCSSSLRP